MWLQHLCVPNHTDPFHITPHSWDQEMERRNYLKALEMLKLEIQSKEESKDMWVLFLLVSLSNSQLIPCNWRRRQSLLSIITKLSQCQWAEFRDRDTKAMATKRQPVSWMQGKRSSRVATELLLWYTPQWSRTRQQINSRGSLLQINESKNNDWSRGSDRSRGRSGRMPMRQPYVVTALYQIV